MNKILLSLTAILLLLSGCASSVTKDIMVDTAVSSMFKQLPK